MSRSLGQRADGLHVQEVRLTVEKRKRVAIEQREGFTAVGFTSVPDGTEDVLLEVRVDVQTLARTLGLKAYRSTGKRSHEAGGAVEVRVLRIDAGAGDRAGTVRLGGGR